MSRQSFLPSVVTNALLVSASVFVRAVSSVPAVNVALQASFNSPPYLLELLETAAEENSTAYFPILDRIAQGHFLDCSTDQELHKTFLQTVQDDGHITTPEALSSFEFALSIHSAAPRIEAHYQYYATSIEPSLMVAQDAACPVWVHFDGKQHCSPALDRAQQDMENPKSLEVLPFDRLLGAATGQAGQASILYADVASPLFGQFHQTVSTTARNGQTSYRVRYRPSSSSAKRPLAMQGYGVELALKRTDYIVIDDRSDDAKDETLVVPAPDSGGEVMLETEEFADLKPLSSSELRGLGLKTASFVMGSDDPFDTLIKVSQDFPKHSSAITKRNFSESLLLEHRNNREVLLPAGYNVVWMNGMQVEARQMDAFALLERMRRERTLISSLRDIGFSGPEAVQLLSQPSIAESKVEGEAQRYDYRDRLEGGNVIVWLNDIGKDKRYQDWPDHLSALLQRTFPGQLPTIRRNVHNAVIPLDLTDLKDVQLLVESIQTFVKRKVPIRFGIVPTSTTAASQDQARLIYHLLDTYGLGAVVSYLEAALQSKKIPGANKGNFESTIQGRSLRRDRNELSFQAVLDDAALLSRVKAGQKYLNRLGATSKTPPLFVNGAAIPRNEGWLQSMSSRVDQDLRSIQRQIFDETIGEATSLEGVLLEKATTSRNALIIPEDESTIQFINFGDLAKKHESIYNKLPRIPGKAEENDNLPAVLLVMTDLDSDEGSSLAIEAIKFSRDNSDVDVALLHSSAARPLFQPSIVLWKYVQEHGWNISADMVQTILALKQVLLKEDKPLDLGYGEEEIETAEAFWRSTHPLVDAVGLRAGESGVVFNGRVLGPIPTGTNFTKNEFTQLLMFEHRQRLKPAMAALQSLGFQHRIESPLMGAILSSAIALSTTSDLPEGIFESAPPLRMAQFEQWTSDHTMISAGLADTASIHLVASVDPTSEVAQRWIPMLKVLSELSGVYLKLFLNPPEQMQELPIKRFYRHVLDATPSFTNSGALQDLQATFQGVPKEALLNLALDVPPAWLVAPKESIHDLDNIKLSSLKDSANIDAIYELENILIEGHSRDITTGPPPRGVQLLLGTEKDAHYADTIIMANLGYFQFKANPGYWKIQLQSGRSSQIFHIDSAGQKGYSPQPGDESTDIALMSFQGQTLYPRLSRQEGREEDDVLEEPGKAGKAMDYLSKAAKFASSVLSNAGLAPQAETQANINIFSVASGHLYERMLNIMMVSVMRHTNHTVKFWFIEQFLSPSFKASLPALAEHYHFSYALVTYKWPHWLRAQKEKQREIWGYKILFLDVLFPLNLDKVIFVDADQIVRTDMYDLVQYNLNGAPYAFTPMCDSRTEMEGFRFWKQGYWKTFLRSLPYHISALYVVDLKLFRQMAAGDRLRQQYHSLSADPNSLSNLDQDLPNHMQHVLPIHSLPQEWLWCETWCADEALQEARTIDLCNNPLTKEPKLERARRQVPEWTVYDDEIAGVLRRAREGVSDVAEDASAGAGDGDGDGGKVVGEPEGKTTVRDEL